MGPYMVLCQYICDWCLCSGAWYWYCWWEFAGLGTGLWLLITVTERRECCYSEGREQTAAQPTGGCTPNPVRKGPEVSFRLTASPELH